MKKVLLTVLLAALMIFPSCTKKDSNELQQGDDQTASNENNSYEDNNDLKEEHPMVTISVKDFGDMVFELYPEYAPETVQNFLDLAESGFYKNLTFHRIYKGFMIQGGSTDGMGMAGSDKTIKGEFSANGVDNPISHERGVISMARTNDPDSASSQFFICDADSTFLDGQYAAFGKLVEGFDVLDAIASVEVTRSALSGEVSQPLVAPVIENITVNK